jgi:hypothetical protein
MGAPTSAVPPKEDLMIDTNCGRDVRAPANHSLHVGCGRDVRAPSDAGFLKTLATKTVAVFGFQFCARFITQVDLRTPATVQADATGKFFATAFTGHITRKARRYHSRDLPEFAHQCAAASSETSIARRSLNRPIRFSSAATTSTSSPRKLNCSP